MSYSAVAICNLALRRIGVSQAIESLDEDSEEAEECNAVYENLRDEVLRGFPWPFATTIVALSLIEEDPNDEWDYSYRYPVGCLRALRIVDGLRGQGTPIPFKIAMGTTSKVLWCDQEDAELEYIAQVTDPARFDTDFASALAWRIAAEIAPALARDRSYTDRAWQNWGAALSIARASALNERQTDTDPEAPWIQARGG